MREIPFVARDGRRGIIREAGPRDARACLEISRAAMTERPRTLMVSPDEFWDVRQWRRYRLGWEERGVWLVAELDGRVVGIVTVSRGPRPNVRHTAELGIVVASGVRGIGVGRSLMEAIERWASEHGVIKLVLRVFSKNTRARALYEKMGYEVEGIERRQVRFPDGEEIDSMLMAKFLPEHAAPWS